MKGRADLRQHRNVRLHPAIAPPALVEERFDLGNRLMAAKNRPRARVEGTQQSRTLFDLAKSSHQPVEHFAPWRADFGVLAERVAGLGRKNLTRQQELGQELAGMARAAAG